MSTGWVSIHRKIFNNPLWLAEKFTKAQAWIDLILLANHEKGYIIVRGIKIEIDRGQVGWSEVSLSARWKWSRTKVKNFLELLEKEQQIKQQKNNVSLVITIVNYDMYQEKYNKKSSKVDSKKAAEEQQKDPNNNVNNENNVNNVNKYSDEIINFANSYQKYISKEYQKAAPEITDRLIESCCDTVEKLIRIDGFTFDEIYKVIQWSAKDDFWSDQIMSLSQLRKKAKNGNKKFVNLYTAYQKKQSPQLNSAERRLISNIEIGREWLNE